MLTKDSSSEPLSAPPLHLADQLPGAGREEGEIVASRPGEEESVWAFAETDLEY